MRILTNHPGRVASPSWRAVATYMEAPRGFIASLALGVRMFMRRREYDCVVLGAGRSDVVFALLQSLLPVRRRPTVMIDCLWYERRNRLAQALKVLIMRIADRSVDRYCVWASREIAAFSNAFGLRPEKFVFVPYHTTLDAAAISGLADGEYLFAGGSSGREYRTLIEAMRGVPATLHIACATRELFEGLAIPPNVTVASYPHHDYMRMLAGCAVNVVALAGGLLHSAGQQTFLNSMWLGKPTVVTDPEGASDYIENGVDGYLVEPGDVATLRGVLMRLVTDPALRRQVGERARTKVAVGYSTDDHFRTIIGVAADAAGVDNPARDGSPTLAAPVEQ